MNERVLWLRREIERLKTELRTLEEGELSEEERVAFAASTVCAHDEILANLRKMALMYDQENRAVLACWQRPGTNRRERWYSTTVTPAKLPLLIRDPAKIAEVLRVFTDETAAAILQALFGHEEGMTLEELRRESQSAPGALEEVLARLRERGYISGESPGPWRLTQKGWQFYIVLAHLVYVQEIKVPPEKILEIAPAFYETYGIQWGDHLGREPVEVLAAFRENGWLKKLEGKGVSEQDIIAAVLEHNV